MMNKNITIESRISSTGSTEELVNSKVITYNLGKYKVKIRLSSNNEFIGIEEIKINKDFLSNKQKTSAPEYHDVIEFYK